MQLRELYSSMVPYIIPVLFLMLMELSVFQLNKGLCDYSNALRLRLVPYCEKKVFYLG